MVTQDTLTRISNTLRRRLEREFAIEIARTTLVRDSGTPHIEYHIDGESNPPLTILEYIDTQTFLYNRTEYQTTVGLYRRAQAVFQTGC